jgi:Fe-S-cluster containining protein
MTDPFQPAHAELEALYGDLADELEDTVRCDLSGLCCDFERSGHVLMSTDLEVSYARAHGAADPPAAKPGACPFFRKGTCHLRDGRPLGCRVYFCDPAYADRMQEIGERYHRRIVDLHGRHGLPYRYRKFVESIRPE